MITAEEAKIQTQAVLNERYQVQEAEISRHITEAIKKGSYSCNYVRIEPGLRKILENRGYKVAYQSSPRADESYYIISWS